MEFFEIRKFKGGGAFRVFRDLLSPKRYRYGFSLERYGIKTKVQTNIQIWLYCSIWS